MKLHFEDNLDYQNEAILSAVDLFRGQELSRNEFTVTHRSRESPQIAFDFTESDLGIGNKFELPDNEILKNLQDIQFRNGLSPSGSLASCDFTVEMETGTGKTYVYLRTIFEMNKRYGFTKFIIVVPSVAIKEGYTKLFKSPRNTSKTSTRWQGVMNTFNTTPLGSPQCATLPLAQIYRS